MPDPLPAGYQVDVSPNGTKCSRSERAVRAITLRYDAAQPAQYQYVCLVGQLDRRCRWYQERYPDRLLAMTGWVFRQRRRSKKDSAFLDTPLTSGAAVQRVSSSWGVPRGFSLSVGLVSAGAIYQQQKRAATELGLFRGQSVHSFRCGRCGCAAL